MKIIKLNSKTDRDKILNIIDPTKAGKQIMRKKMKLNLFYIKDIKTPAANILKQDALSIGADLAVGKDTILCKDEFVDGLLIADDRQVEILSKKELAQPFGLKELALKLTSYKSSEELKFPIKIMGIINANSDSFYEKSRFVGENALEKIIKMVEDGADIVDIGGVSSRPGSEQVLVEEELNRVKPIIDLLYKDKIYDKTTLSIDSYEPKVIEYALDHGFKIANDITGLEDDNVSKLVAKYDASVVIMHKKGTPKNMQKNPSYENVLLEIEDFFTKRVDKAKGFGIKDIILDVGIGFGKNLKHNLLLIKHLSHFKEFGYPLLIGASRKSLIDMIVPTKIEDRLHSSIVLHLKALENGASIIRCHDVKEHYDAIKIHKALEEVIL